MTHIGIDDEWRLERICHPPDMGHHNFHVRTHTPYVLANRKSITAVVALFIESLATKKRPQLRDRDQKTATATRSTRKMYTSSLLSFALCISICNYTPRVSLMNSKVRGNRQTFSMSEPTVWNFENHLNLPVRTHWRPNGSHQLQKLEPGKWTRNGRMLNLLMSAFTASEIKSRSQLANQCQNPWFTDSVDDMQQAKPSRMQMISI